MIRKNLLSFCFISFTVIRLYLLYYIAQSLLNLSVDNNDSEIRATDF